jgi:hypothetical protein
LLPVGCEFSNGKISSQAKGETTTSFLSVTTAALNYNPNVVAKMIHLKTMHFKNTNFFINGTKPVKLFPYQTKDPLKPTKFSDGDFFLGLNHST